MPSILASYFGSRLSAIALVSEIRDAAAWVAERAETVQIEKSAIAVYAQSLPVAADSPAPDPDAHIVSGPPELRAAFFLTLDAINFGSGWFPTLRKREGRSGYYTIALGLRDRFIEHGAWSAEELQGMTAGEIAAVLGQDPDHELMEHFARSLNDLGRQIGDRYGGDFLGPIGDSAVALVEELADWDCFADRSDYDGREIPIYKRAQIAAADLVHAGVADFPDLARLTLFADNLVPHVLRLDGILRFDPDLVRRIENGKLLIHGSPEEVEMRCCAIRTADLILAERPDLTADKIDSLLWHRGGGASYKAHPRPRCRCTAY